MANVSVSYSGLDIDVASMLTDELIRFFQYIGEECVNEARSKEKQNDWHDCTGNLRSSIGYCILRDGIVINESAPQTFAGPIGNGEKGQENARSMMARLRANFPRGLVLIVVAGMEYASLVEERGRNVLTSANLKAEDLVRQMTEELSRTLNQ